MGKQKQIGTNQILSSDAKSNRWVQTGADPGLVFCETCNPKLPDSHPMKYFQFTLPLNSGQQLKCATLRVIFYQIVRNCRIVLIGAIVIFRRPLKWPYQIGCFPKTIAKVKVNLPLALDFSSQVYPKNKTYWRFTSVLIDIVG